MKREIPVVVYFPQEKLALDRKRLRNADRMVGVAFALLGVTIALVIGAANAAGSPDVGRQALAPHLIAIGACVVGAFILMNAGVRTMRELAFNGIAKENYNHLRTRINSDHTTPGESNA